MSSCLQNGGKPGLRKACDVDAAEMQVGKFSPLQWLVVCGVVVVVVVDVDVDEVFVVVVEVMIVFVQLVVVVVMVTVSW